MVDHHRDEMHEDKLDRVPVAHGVVFAEPQEIAVVPRAGRHHLAIEEGVEHFDGPPDVFRRAVGHQLLGKLG